MTLEEHLHTKQLHRRHRYGNSLHKANERLRTATYQRTIDDWQRTWRRKGHGQEHKEKGKTMPTLLCSNNRCAKGWKHLNGHPMQAESMKVAIIYCLT